MRSTNTVLVFCGLVFVSGLPAADDKRPAFTSEQIDYFERQIHPILAQQCWNCHAEETQESDLRLDSRAAVLGGGASGPAAVAGKPAASLLVQAVRPNGDLEMPPDSPLTAEQVAALETWISMGIPWSKGQGGEDDAPVTTDQRSDEFRMHHWSLARLKKTALPTSVFDSWALSPLDRLIAAKLAVAGLVPSNTADHRTLIRRATFDLLGRPPTPFDAERFVGDSTPDAYERLVDRLLASPQFGQRWGRHWLDVARYADTRGYAFARDRRYPFAYTYRDYVVDAFNADLPYDQFIREQLAADRIELGDDRRPLAALGFLTVGRKFNNQHDDIDDKIDAVTRGFMGLTVACARCHDHKYDPIPTEDYYSLYGIFASCQEPDDLPLIGMLDDVSEYQGYLDELNHRQQQFDEFAEARHAEILEHARRRAGDYLVQAAGADPEKILDSQPFLSLNPEELRPRLITRWRDYLKKQIQPNHPLWMPWSRLAELDKNEFAERAAVMIGQWKTLPAEDLNPLVRQAIETEVPKDMTDVARRYGGLLEETYEQWQEAGANDEARKKLAAEQQQLVAVLWDPSSPTAIKRDEIRDYLSREHAEKHNALRIAIDQHQAAAPAELPRAMVVRDKDQPVDGQVFIRGNHARRGATVPRRFLTVLSDDAINEFRDGSGRLELARAIVHQAQPLTARVIANRVWMHHFGQPLVDSPSDFGARSEPPLHRDVLDYLAWRLVDGGWSLKSLHREILLSSTYRQASIDRSEGSAADPENRLYWRMNRRRLEFEPLHDSVRFVAGSLDLALGGKPVDIFRAPFSRRRAVYAVIDRQDLPNLLRAFDFASPDQSAARRPNTTVPQQALFLMNSPFIAEQASALAQRIESMALASADDRIATLYGLLFQREPSPDEMRIAGDFVEAASSSDDATSLDPWSQFAQLLLLTNEFCFVD